MSVRRIRPLCHVGKLLAYRKFMSEAQSWSAAEGDCQAGLQAETALLVDPSIWIKGDSIILPATGLLLAVVAAYGVVLGRSHVIRDRIICSSMTKMQRNLGTLRNEVTQDLRVASSYHAESSVTPNFVSV
jgi:hypothetical protein